MELEAQAEWTQIIASLFLDWPSSLVELTFAGDGDGRVCLSLIVSSLTNYDIVLIHKVYPVINLGFSLPPEPVQVLSSNLNKQNEIL